MPEVLVSFCAKFPSRARSLGSMNRKQAGALPVDPKEVPPIKNRPPPPPPQHFVGDGIPVTFCMAHPKVG